MILLGSPAGHESGYIQTGKDKASSRNLRFGPSSFAEALGATRLKPYLYVRLNDDKGVGSFCSVCVDLAKQGGEDTSNESCTITASE